MDLYALIFEAIQTKLKALGITEKDCLQECGINRSFFSDWRGGRSKRQNFDSIYKICKFLNVSIDNLGENQTALTKEESLPRDEQRLLEKYRAIDEDGKDVVKGVLTAEYRRCMSEANNCKDPFEQHHFNTGISGTQG